MEEVEFKIDGAASGLRVDRLLRKLLPHMPLSHVHKMLRKGMVRRDSGRARLNDRLDEGDVLKLLLSPDDATALRARLSGKKRRHPRKSMRLPVLYEDEHIIAFDKPSGIAVHPGSGHALEDTLLGALLERTGDGGAVFRPGLVGRLDRDASGVQLAGCSPKGLRGLEKLSRARRIKKVYVALVRGERLPDKGRIEAPLVDTEASALVTEASALVTGDGRARMQPGDGGMNALTLYNVLARGKAALVEVRLETALRHQIRAHFASIGAHIAGDVRYGDRAWNDMLGNKAGLERLFLHCTEAAFKHPVTGRDMRVTSKLPQELLRVLTALDIRGWGNYGP